MPVKLFVLGLLAKQPLHGYEIRKWLEKSRTDLWADMLPGSIYHALKKMAEVGLVKLSRVESSGKRKRTIYEITPQGRTEFRNLLNAAWTTKPHSIPAEINTALAFIDELPTQQILESVQATILELEADLDAWTSGETRKAEYTEITDLIKASFINGRDHINADLAFLKRIQDLLRAHRAPAGSPAV